MFYIKNKKCDICFENGVLIEKCCSFKTCKECFFRLKKKNCPQCNKIIKTPKKPKSSKILSCLKIVILSVLFILLIPINIIWCICASILTLFMWFIVVIFDIFTCRLISFDDEFEEITSVLFGCIYEQMKNIKKKILILRKY